MVTSSSAAPAIIRPQARSSQSQLQLRLAQLRLLVFFHRRVVARRCLLFCVDRFVDVSMSSSHPRFSRSFALAPPTVALPRDRPPSQRHWTGVRPVRTPNCIGIVISPASVHALPPTASTLSQAASSAAPVMAAIRMRQLVPLVRTGGFMSSIALRLSGTAVWKDPGFRPAHDRHASAHVKLVSVEPEPEWLSALRPLAVIQ